MQKIVILSGLVAISAVFSCCNQHQKEDQNFENILGQENAVWSEAIYFKGQQSSTHETLTDEYIRTYAQTLKKNHIKYSYFFAGPFGKDGHLPAYVFSATARQSVQRFKVLYPGLQILPWCGGIQNKNVYLNDSVWCRNAINDIRKMIRLLDVPGVHIDFECLEQGYEWVDTAVTGLTAEIRKAYPGNVNRFHKVLRDSLPHAFISSVVVSTCPQSKHWKRKTTLAELTELVPYIDQLNFLYYDTNIKDSATFRQGAEMLIKGMEVLKTVHPVQTLVAIGTFNNPAELNAFHHHDVENIANTLSTLRTAARKINPAAQIVDGISIYGGWETSTPEWELVQHNWTDYKKKNRIHRADSYTETDPSLLNVGDTAIYYISHQGNSYQLNELKGGNITVIEQFSQPVYQPFQFQNQIGILYDSCGNDAYLTNLPAFNQLLKGQKLEKIYSDQKGKYLIYKKHKGNWYLYTAASKTIKVLDLKGAELKQLNFANEQPLAACTVDDQLFTINLRNATLQQILVTHRACYNPFIHRQQVYYAAYDTGNHTAIYRMGLNTSAKPERIISKKHDLRMPKFRDGQLYYLEIDHGLYTLHQHVPSGDPDRYFQKYGVTYNYELIDSHMVYVASDPEVPRSIRRTTTSSHFTLSYSNGVQLESQGKGSFAVPAFPESIPMLWPNHMSPKATILYIHPDQHGNYAFRFDPILYNLVQQGYHIVCPNYPGSTGNGWLYENANFATASKYLVQLKTFLAGRYGSPLYILTSSSGNLFLEELQNTDPSDITAAAVICGLSYSYEINPSIPTLQLLGENDQQVDYLERSNQIKNDPYYNNTVFIHSYPGEGHWLRKSENIDDAAIRIDDFFERRLHKN